MDNAIFKTQLELLSQQFEDDKIGICLSRIQTLVQYGKPENQARTETAFEAELSHKQALELFRLRQDGQ